MRSRRGSLVMGIIVVLALFAPMGTAGAATSPFQRRDTVTDVRPRKADIKAVRVDNDAVIRLTGVVGVDLVPDVGVGEVVQPA